jgi:hypothetical protein
MKKSLLATVAAAALFAGSGLAVAQGAKDQPSGKGGGAEMQRGADTKGGGSEMKGGQAAGEKADKAKPSTTGQSSSEQQAPGQRGAQGERGQDKQMQRGAQGERGQDKQMQQRSQDSDKQRSTTGQGSQERGAQQGSEPRRSEPQRGESQRGTQQGTQGTQQQRSGAQQNQTTGQGAAGSTQAGGAVNLTSEQKTKIRTSVLQSSSAPKIERSKVNFNIGVGTVVPRTINLVAVPPTLVEIHPQWRGYRYFIVDEEIIIVEPSSFKIVAVVSV